ncbi:ribonuclease T2 [Coccomyxa subellipsoidea C-169]|uniref:Ribonuclease T2 n=1 Tax=Coccomyxa subellipsoidea (strain C-169) TaxID=574566 RepID=I0YUU5_COCSC|nr:ribonuclease T2 [Coccomyxa subellipsoidea C-169]EIE22164.1 ribonuclease T2 [Coccomyxa subellipsoidea C-169]|eukprot:XP_005646708.1 ribonuclease T2 [Coccomyxa subellipsoidea C-169]
MDIEWPSYTTENPCFWEHEWDCHGSCSNFSQQNYFQKTLDLHKRYDIAAALAAKGIQPSETPVSRSDFLDALEADFGVRPLLYCQGGGGKDYINEIFMCFTQDLKAVNCEKVCRTQPCEPRGAQQCNDELIYKLGPVASKAERPCSNNFRQCHEKSGTCKRGNQLGLNMSA